MLPLIYAILFTLVAGGIPASSQPPEPKPISRQGFLKAVEIGGLSSEELASLIRERGVEFRLNGEDRAVLAKARVDEAVVEAIEASFRGDAKNPSSTAAIVAQHGSGPRLTRLALIGLMEQGHPSEALEKIVEMRGIDFLVTPESAKEVEAAGGRRELLGAMILRQPHPPAAPENPAPEPRTPPAGVETTVAVAAPAVAPPLPVSPPEGTPAPMPGAAPGLAPDLPLRVDPAVQAVRLLRRVAPDYPHAARRDRVGGNVKLEVLIGEDGLVKKCRILAGHPYLAAAAEAAVRRWSYLPAVVEGRAVSVMTQVELQFRLDSR